MGKSTIIKKIMKLAVDNKSTILTLAEVIGIVGTAFLTAEASFKASKKIEEIKETAASELKVKDIVKEVAPDFIPATVACAATVGICVYHNYVSLKDLASIAALYQISENKLGALNEGMLKTVGEKKSNEVMDAVMRDHINNNPPSQRALVLTGKGDYLCIDGNFGTTFRSEPEYIRQAFNNIKDKLHDSSEEMASVNELYSELGLGRLGVDSDLYGEVRDFNVGDFIGWNKRVGDKLSPHYGTFTDPITRENCFIFTYDFHQIVPYD